MRHVSRRDLELAVLSGDVVVDARGKYALPHADQAIRAAHRLTGVVSHRSAVAHWGWEQKAVPSKPEITLPKNRLVNKANRSAVVVHRTDLSEDDVDGLVTSRRRTLVDVLRSCPFDEAVAVADSALRVGDLTRDDLDRIGVAARGPGSAQVRRVAAVATAQAANPFESILRALAIEVGLSLRPQVPIFDKRGSFIGRPDLVEIQRRLILEADSFEWHGSRSALQRDARRYNKFVIEGWTVLRFTWADVTRRPDYVRGSLLSFASLGTATGTEESALRRRDAQLHINENPSVPTRARNRSG